MNQFVSDSQSWEKSPVEIQWTPRGGTLNVSAYVGSDPASTFHPKKYQEFQAPQKIFEI